MKKQTEYSTFFSIKPDSDYCVAEHTCCVFEEREINIFARVFNKHPADCEVMSTRLIYIHIYILSFWFLFSPPAGCTEYMMTSTGRITSYNFDATNSIHLADQE